MYACTWKNGVRAINSYRLCDVKLCCVCYRRLHAALLHLDVAMASASGGTAALSMPWLFSTFGLSPSTNNTDTTDERTAGQWRLTFHSCRVRCALDCHRFLTYTYLLFAVYYLSFVLLGIIVAVKSKTSSHKSVEWVSEGAERALLYHKLPTTVYSYTSFESARRKRNSTSTTTTTATQQSFRHEHVLVCMRVLWRRPRTKRRRLQNFFLVRLRRV